MAVNLPKYLKFLHDTLPGTGSETFESDSQAFYLATDISRVLQSLKSASEVANVCSLMFNGNDGISLFLRKSALHDKFFNARFKLVTCIEEFIGNYGEVVLPYAVEIKDVCLLLYSRDTKAEMRIKVLRIITMIVEVSAGKQVGIDLNSYQITERFYSELANKPKPTVLQVILELLGTLADSFPENTGHYSEKLLKVYHDRLKQQMTSKIKSPEFPVISGCFTGLNLLLNVISDKLSESDRHSVFEFICLAIGFNPDVKRYQYIRAVLRLIARHAGIFRDQIYKDWLRVFENLNKWFHHSNHDVKIAAISALESYFKQMANMLCDKLEASDGCRSEAERIFKYFAGTFCETLGKNQSIEISIAIQGYGYFAAPCKRLKSGTDVKVMFTEVINRCEDLFFSTSGFVEENLELLPSFVSALASIMLQLNDVSEIFLISLENLVVCLIDNYGKVSEKRRYFTYGAIIKLCIALYPKGAVFKSFIDRIVFQGILRTCQHPVPQELTGGATNDDDFAPISYRNYLDLWSNLLEIVKFKELNDIGVSISDRQVVTYAIYDGLISSILTIIAKLDFSLDHIGDNFQNELSADPVIGLQAVKPKDFQIFVNLVEFSREFLLKDHLILFKKWINDFGHMVISYSSKFPLVSGFYKLFAVVLKICCRINYFTKLKALESCSGGSSASADVNSRILKCYILFTKCAKEISVRLQQYKDELLVSCFQVILSLPVEIVEEIQQSIIVAVGRAISLGHSYLPLMNDVLTALEYWGSRLSSDVLLSLYQSIIPMLNGFLTAFSYPVEVEQWRDGKRPSKLTKSSKSSVSFPQSMSTVMEIKSRIVKFLGTLGGNVNCLLIDDRLENIGEVALAWDSKKLLKFTIPFLDMKPTIYLGMCDRQTKVAASELLHALILYLLGSRAVLQPDLQMKKPMTKLLSRLFPAVVKLSCDIDLVVHQMFKSLLFQLIHWFSNQRQEILNDQVALFDSLMDGVTNATDISLRDSCAEGIKELLHWTIKHSTKTKLKKHPFGTKLILKRMYSLCLHPKASLRLGAALIFNNIYTVFREEEVLVDRFIIEILYYFIESLAMADKDEKHFGTLEKCQAALKCVEKIIVVKSSMLQKKNAVRRKPQDFEHFQNTDSDWDQMLLWLLNQFGRPESECRHYCMHLLTKLTSIASAQGTTAYFESLLKLKGAGYFVSMFEGDSKIKSERLQIRNCPLMTDYLKNGFSIVGAMSWLQLILSCLDCYTYVIAKNFLQSSDLFAANSQSVVFKVVNYFNSDVALANLLSSDFCKNLSINTDIFTPSEINDYCQLKCTVIVRIMDFVSMIANNSSNSNKFIVENFVTESFWKVIIACIFHPLNVEFDMSNSEVENNLPEKIKNLILILLTMLPTRCILEFKSLLSTEISYSQSWTRVNELSKVVKNLNLDELIKFRWLVTGFVLLNEVNLLPTLINFTADQVPGIAVNFLNQAFEMSLCNRDDFICAKTLESHELHLAQELLRLSFSLKLCVKTLLDQLADETLINHSTGHNKISKSEHYLVTFRLWVVTYIVENADISVPYMINKLGKLQMINSSILLSVIDSLADNSQLRKKYSRVFVEKMFRNWQNLQSLWHPKASPNVKRLIVFTLQRVLVLEAKALLLQTNLTNNKSDFTSALDSFLCLLVDTNINLTFKGHLLDLLPNFTSLTAEYSLELKKNLIKMAVMHFPLKSSQLPVKSPQYNEYITVFTKFLFALEMSGSLMILELLLELVCVEPKHVCDDYLQNTLASVIKNASLEKQRLLIYTVYNLYDKGTAEEEGFRQIVVEKFLAPLLSRASGKVVIDFFEENIKAITSSIADKSLKTNDVNYYRQLVSKLCSLILVTILYNRCTGNQLNTLESRVNTSFCGGSAKTGKELTQEITRAAHNIKKENMQGETAFLEMRRRCRCAAYNCLIAVISCTQTDVKFYTGFLFSENPVKGEYLWDNLIDVNQRYEFNIELDSPFERKKTLSSLRHQFRRKSSPDDNDGDVGDSSELDESFALTVRTSQVTHLAESSLAEEVSQFDMMSSSQILNSGSNKRQRIHKENNKQHNDNQEMSSYIELEMDLLNQHECMVTINRLLRYLHEFVTLPPTNGADVIMPSWMKAIHQKFSDESCSKNVKLFFGKLIVNNDKVFQPYASSWLPPLLQFLIEYVPACGMDYMVVDLLVILLSWSSVALPDDNTMGRSLAFRLLELLMKNAYHSRRDILRNNLEIIKTVVECWKSRLDTPVKVILENLNSSNRDGNENLIGVQFLGIILSCDLPPYSYTVGINEEGFLNALPGNMKHESKAVYGAAAEVTGLVLKYLSTREKTDNFPFFQLVCKQVSQLKLNMDKFLTCVNGIQKGFPPIVDSFSNQIVFYLPKTRGIYRQISLQCLHARVDAIDGLYLQLKSIGLYDYIEHDVEGIQVICLMIVSKIIGGLSDVQVLDVFDLITTFIDHSDVNCRKMMCEILIKTYTQFADNIDIVDRARRALLKTLSDSDVNIRLMVLNFLGHETKLSMATLDRAVAVLSHLYSSDCEKIFLSAATYLLLELTSKSPEYSRLIFDNPLSDCKFENYNVSADWRVRHASMMPLFVETMSTDLLVYSTDDDSSQQQQYLRATQESLAFTPTQNADSRPFDWISQSSNDSSAGDFTSVDEIYSSRLLFKSKRQTMLTRKSSTSVDSNHENHGESNLSLLKRKFIKSADEQKKYFMKKNVMLQQRRVNLATEQKLAREAKVAIYRQYRKGDFPDIQIPVSSVIAPLQALAQRDDDISKMLFSNLIVSIVNEVQEDTVKHNESIAKIENSLNEILLQTFHYTPCVISAIHEIGLKMRGSLNLDIPHLSAASEHSFQHNTGILLLEDMINHRMTSRTSVSENKDLWVALAKVNKSQGNYDVVNGIISYNFGLPQEAREAFEAEGRGDYSLAFKLMKKFHNYLRTVDDEDRDSSEYDLWNNSILLCYDQLCQWDKLDRWTTKCFDPADTNNLSIIWENSYPERYMEYFMRSNVKRIIEGSNNQSFIDFLDTSLNDISCPEKRQFLENRFSHELSLLSIVQKEYNRAWHYSTLSITNFLNYWAAISDLSTRHRKYQLEKLQSVVETDSFLQLVKSPVSTNNLIIPLLKTWQNNLPCDSSSAHIINDIVSNRNLYIKRLQSDHASTSLNESQNEGHVDISDLLHKSRFSFAMACVETASSENNFSLALSKLKESMKLYQKSNDSALQKQWILAYCKTHQGETLNQENREKVKSLLNVWHNLDKHIKDDETDRSILLESKLIHSRNADLMLKYLEDDFSLLQVIKEEQSVSVLQLINCRNSSSVHEVLNGLVNFSFQSLNDAKSLCGDDMDKNAFSVADAHLQLATFCDKYLKENDDLKSSARKLDQSNESLANNMVENLLKSIKHGSSEGMQIFPRLLQILESFPSTSNIFMKIVKEIPVWMFLRWNSQLVALLDKPCATVLHPLVISIAELYPLALVYNFNVSKQGYKFSNSKVDRHNKEVTKRLESIFDRLELVKEFILALECLDHPRSRFLDFFNTCSRSNVNECIKCYLKYYDDELVKLQTSSIGHGKVFSSFIKKFMPLFKKAFGEDNCRIKKMTLTEIIKELQVIKKNIDATEPAEVKLLKDYSEWMASFSAIKCNEELEIPGQYTGYCKPIPEYHVKIAKFNESIEVLQSIRRPKAITVIGNDCKEYKYLVKSGEDLRLDQRIQQLFYIMNGIYSRDSACRSRQLRLITYQVVPLTVRLGWLEWAPNTTALKSFLEKGIDENDKSHNQRCTKTMLTFLKKFSSETDLTKIYRDYYLKCDATKAIAKFSDVVKESPNAALRKSFWNISASSEAFITLRNNFIVSHSVICISQYVLGIGDRHLSNFLVSLKTGEMIGIDFGHSFDSATSFLPIPELIPFRLTPQFLNLMEPMREHGLLERTMVHAMRALRNHPDILNNTMDVFIKEPSLDWEAFAAKLQGSNINGDTAWYPKQRIGFAIQKLEGRNSAYITFDQLKYGIKRDTEVMDRYKQVCLGSLNANYRAKLKDERLSVEKQVLCLIDHATDPHVLSKTYFGWAPWM
ncbi:hypothetical protein CHUAL_011747 [Chamberlinius hualienensis]